MGVGGQQSLEGMQGRESSMCLVLNEESPGLVRELSSIREQKSCRISEQGRYGEGFSHEISHLGV